MIEKRIILFLLSLLTFFSCQNNENPNDSPEEIFSITRKWYTNAEDDRYFYEFKTDGSLYYRYYQNIDSSLSNLNTFVTKIGTWRYLNNEKTRFTVGWDDSIDCYYKIEEENSEKLIVTKDSSGPAGRGLGITTELLKSAAIVSYTVPDEIVNLIGIWYYNETKDGKYLKFQTDGICYYHFYQDYGIDSGLTGWVNIKGIWYYNSETKKISITMKGEITYSYEIEILNVEILKITGASNSMIMNSNQFYK